MILNTLIFILLDVILLFYHKTKTDQEWSIALYLFALLALIVRHLFNVKIKELL